MGARSRGAKSAKSLKKSKDNEQTVQVAEENQPKSLWQKIFHAEAELTPEEALTAAHWIRQFIALLLGTLFGVIQMTGFPALLTFFLVSLVGPSALISQFRELDVEEISKVNSMQTEGFMPATALFLLSWIVSYTVFLPSHVKV